MIPRLALLLLCLLAALPGGEAPAEMRRVREMAAQDKRRGEAAAMCRRIAEDAARPGDERERAARLLPVLLAAAGQEAEARAEAARLAAARPADRHAAGIPALVDAVLAAGAGRRDEAAAALRALAEGGDPGLRARAQLHLAALLARDAKGKPAAAEAQAQATALAEAAAAGADDPWDAREALRLGREAAERARDPAALERILRGWLREPVAGIIEANERNDAIGRLGRALQDGKRFDEARALYRAELEAAQRDLDALLAAGDAVEQRAFNERNGRAVGALLRWNLDTAYAWRNQGDPAAAIAAAEAVFAVPSDPGYEWNAAGQLVIECLADAPDRAVAAARTMYEAVGGGDAAKTLARLLAKGDKAEEKAVLAWLGRGSADEDGAADGGGPARTLPARASHPARAAAARGIALTTTYQARRRANLLLYAGEPAEAAAVVRWWIGQARSAAEIGALAEVLARCAAALAGDPAARARALRYVADGPAGPDGVAGSADDLPDPLPGIAAFAPPAPTGADAEALRRLRATAMRIRTDDRVSGDLRGNASATILRIDLLFSTRPTPDELLSWYDGGLGMGLDLLAADRFAGDGHLGGLGEVLARVDADGFDKLPDWIKARRKSWTEVQAVMRAGKPSKAWW